MASAHWVVFIDSYYGKLFSFWWFNVGSHFTRPRSLYTAGDISKIKTTNSFINMLLPVQLSLPLFYEKTGLYLRSKLDQRKVRNDAQYLFFKLFSTSVQSTSFLFRILRKHTECRKGQWKISPLDEWNEFVLKMINSGPKGRWSELLSPGCIHDRQHWGKHYCSPEKPQFIRKLNFMMK